MNNKESEYFEVFLQRVMERNERLTFGLKEDTASMGKGEGFEFL